MSSSASTDRRIGRFSALTVFFIGVAYVATGAIGVRLGGGSARGEPLTQIDPFLAFLEILIILVAPLMVVLMAAVHACAPRGAKTYSLSALCFMILLAGITGSIHFVQLTVARRIESAGDAPLSVIFFSKWPSVLFALDLLGWDLFLGLSLLLAAPVFKGDRLQAAIRVGLILSGALCIGGLLGPALGDLRFQVIGITGYALVFPVVCLLIARLFARSDVSGRRETEEREATESAATS